MNDQKKPHKKGNWGVRSVYLVLAVCLVAVAAAAWTTFRSISSTLSGSTPDPDLVQSQLIEPTGETVSGVTASEEPSAPASEPESEPAAPTDTTPETLQPPLANGVQQSYSGGELVYSQTLKDWRTHNGTDFQADQGETVQAMADGTVTKVYDDGLLGNVVIVASGELEALYCGLAQDIPVQEGDTVTAGQPLGTVDVIPAEQSEPSHLHLEVRRDGEPFDCEPLLQPAE